MMLALGCIQALECNKNSCPTGITTQDPQLMVGLVPEDKAQRIANYHGETVKSVAELVAAAGLNGPRQVDRSHICHRTSSATVSLYDETYPYPESGCLLQRKPPEAFKRDFDEASPESFQPAIYLPGRSV
jgi:hypothetical protein